MMDVCDDYPLDAYFMEDKQTRELLKSIPTPFYLFDEQTIRERARKLNEDLNWCNEYAQYFPIAACPNLEIMKILRDSRVGASAGSAIELNMAVAAGFTGDQILFSPPFPEKTDFLAAQAAHPIVVLSDPEVAKIYASYGALGSTVCLRYNPGEYWVRGMKRTSRSKLGMLESEMRALIPQL